MFKPWIWVGQDLDDKRFEMLYHNFGLGGNIHKKNHTSFEGHTENKKINVSGWHTFVLLIGLYTDLAKLTDIFLSDFLSCAAVEASCAVTTGKSFL